MHHLTKAIIYSSKNHEEILGRRMRCQYLDSQKQTFAEKGANKRKLLGRHQRNNQNMTGSASHNVAIDQLQYICSLETETREIVELIIASRE